MCSTRASGSRCRRVIWSGLSAASNSRARPSQLRKVPAFSTTAATGRTTSARSVTSRGRSSRLTRKPTSSSAASGAGRVRQVRDLDARHDQERAELAGRRGLDDLAGVPAVPVRQFGHAPGGGDLVAGPRVGGRTAAGQQPGQRARLDGAALARPARDPHQAGAGGGGRRVRRRSARRAPPPAARRRRSPRRRRAAPRPRRCPVAVQADAARERVQPLGLGAGRGRQQRAARLRQAAGGVGGEREGALAVLAVRLAQPQEDAGRLLLGLDTRPAARRAPSPARCR